MLTQRLEEAGIETEFFASSGYLSAYKHAQGLDIEAYSAIVASGGDGTVHEVVNGMLARDDKKRVPVGFIPNGSGNDICYNLEIRDIESAIKNIIRG